jgi:hypothetical protein
MSTKAFDFSGKEKDSGDSDEDEIMTVWRGNVWGW